MERGEGMIDPPTPAEEEITSEIESNKGDNTTKKIDDKELSNISDECLNNLRKLKKAPQNSHKVNESKLRIIK